MWHIPPIRRLLKALERCDDMLHVLANSVWSMLPMLRRGVYRRKVLEDERGDRSASRVGQLLKMALGVVSTPRVAATVLVGN